MKLTALRALLATSITVFALPACSDGHGSHGVSNDGNNITSVNGSVKAEPGVTYGSITTVNGNVRIGRGAIAEAAKTVNGDIELDDESRVGKATTVNGSLRVGEGAAIDKGASTVNGGVTLRSKSRVGGDVETVSGEIELAGAEVTGKLVTRHGDIDLTDGAHVRGGIHVQKQNDSNWGWRDSNPIEVHVCGTCVVDGELRFDQPVKLRVDSGGKIGAVIGDKVTRL